MARGLANFNPSELRAHRMNIYARPDVVSMTAEELAKAIGATKAQVLAYENGHRVPDPPRLRALARALRIHPLLLMDRTGRDTWTLADYRRGSGLRAQDVVSLLRISPKNYRRFENEGIVPSRRPQFIDEAAHALHMPRRLVEAAIDRTPAVKRRQSRAFDLIVAMAERYVPKPGPWKGPASNDPDLIELAAAYGRPVQRVRRVLTYELGELRQSQVRAERERVIADFDTDRDRQAHAQHALTRWIEVFERELARIPRRLELFHRTAQPSEVWRVLVDLYNVDATVRADPGTWVATKLLGWEPPELPRYLVEQRSIDDVEVCRLSAQGANHLLSYSGLYAALYPGVRKPIRPAARPTTKARGAGGTPETFTLPARPERLAIPQPILESTRAATAGTKNSTFVELSPSYELLVGANSLSVVTKNLLLPLEDLG
jgi:transcriptional regulator with XRE-family HTH domain